MAHFFIIPPNLPPLFSRDSVARRHSSHMPRPPQSQAEMSAQDFHGPSSNRNDSVSSSDGSDPPSPGAASFAPAARRNSAKAAHGSRRVVDPSTVRTRSIPGVFGPAGVIFERDPGPPSDDDIIIVTVRLTNKFRKSSVDGAQDLPSRPPGRSFFRRLSTRVSPAWDHAAEKEERYKALKMPRGEYKRHFRRDKDGNYVGTEPERTWDEEGLMREYAAYQEMPLNSIIC